MKKVILLKLYLFVSLSLFFSCSKTVDEKTPSNKTVTIEADFSQTPTTVKSMLGFLHAMNSSSPSDENFLPLKPNLWRAGTLMNQIYPRINASGATPILVIGDIYRYPGDNIFGWQQPYTNLSNWQNFVENIYTSSSAISTNIIYDIWNEPNGSYYWTGTQDQYFQTFKAAHDKIRMLPNGNNAKICGPSLNGIDTLSIRKFMNFCRDNAVKVNILTWHDFRSGNNVLSLDENLIAMRNEYINNPAYASVGVEEIQLNEIVSEAEMMNPAANLAIFKAMENGGAKGGCRACWNESNGQNNCFNNTLNGLLTQETYQKRSVWWAYYYYALGTSNRIPFTSNNDNVSAFISSVSENNNQGQILIGYSGDVQANTVDINFNLKNITNLSFLNGKTFVNIKVKKIKNSGESALSQPETTETYTASINSGGLSISLKNINLNDVYVIQFN